MILPPQKWQAPASFTAAIGLQGYWWFRLGYRRGLHEQELTFSLWVSHFMAYLLIKQQGCKLKQSWYVTPISNGANKWLIELGQCNEHMVSNLLIWVFLSKSRELVHQVLSPPPPWGWSAPSGVACTLHCYWWHRHFFNCSQHTARSSISKI